ncbi:B3 domain-containing protein At3g18960 isoform X1 [Lathyrus oleraceus]|uniref:B3 domain-containing protein At3g18960 isoform X1 n=1 Tax=Pisum sativum TaxID=3888 RepID=UPI0021D1332B|nr:B3 domain-containing protein At3g18960-like isoform X1 [Pisum sativum]
MSSQELDHWNNGVHFFKIILESILQEEKLRVPISFVRRYWKGIENPVTLRLPNMIQKKVFWEKNSDYDVLFCKGWKEFANYLSMGDSQLLVFQYQENSLFNVIVFGKNGLEIKYPVIEISEDSIEIEARKNSLGMIEDPSQKNGKPCDLIDVSYEDNEDLKERSRVLYDKVKNTFHSNKDFFICMIQKTYIERDLLGIPIEFGRKFLRGLQGKNVTLFVNPKKTWIVNLNLTSKHQYTLSGGWRKFRVDNNVKFGDVCVLIFNKSKGKISFKVTIFSLENDM